MTGMLYTVSCGAFMQSKYTPSCWYVSGLGPSLRSFTSEAASSRGSIRVDNTSFSIDCRVAVLTNVSILTEMP